MDSYKINKKYEVWTPSGWRSFGGIRKLQKSCSVQISTTDDKLKCSSNHRIKTKDGWKLADNILQDDCVLSEKGIEKVISVIKETSKIELFDLLDVDTKEYYTNNIVSHNCEFMGSEDTLIRPTKLSALVYDNPMHTTVDGLTIYKEPIKNHNYTITVDTSRALGLDYHAFVMIDVTAMPYQVVAKFRNNTMPVMLLPNIIVAVAQRYNEASLLIETNDTGQQVSDIIHEELEYDNMITTTIKGKKGQRATGFGVGRVQYGVKMSNQVKKTGCLMVKELIENDKLVPHDFDLISELSTYVSCKASYSASDGYNDDLVSCLVLFGWLSTQSYFRDLVNTDIRRKLMEDKLKKLEDDMLPFGFSSAELDDDLNTQESIRELAKEPELKPRKKTTGNNWMSDNSDE